MKRFGLMLLVLLLLSPAAFADPLIPLQDFAGTVTVFYNGTDDADGQYVYAYSYPCVEETGDLSSVCVNEYYRKRIQEYTADYIPSLADYYGGIYQSVSTDITYRITCNNDEFFSVLLHRTEDVEGEVSESWEGNTFARSSEVIGSLTSLPKLLGIVDAGESDEWLEDRQSRRVWEALCRLVWEAVEANPNGIGFYPDLEEEDLEYIIDPVISLDQDFYMDDRGNLVFFVLPGRLAPEDAGLITFTFTLADLKDEL